MFRFSGFIDDKYVTLVLRNLTGIAKDLQMVPVADANVGLDGQLVPQASTTIERFIAEWRKRKLSKIDAAQARELAKSIGLSPTSYGHVLHNAVKGGYIVKAGRRVGKSGSGNSVGYMYALKEEKTK